MRTTNAPARPRARRAAATVLAAVALTTSLGACGRWRAPQQGGPGPGSGSGGDHGAPGHDGGHDSGHGDGAGHDGGADRGERPVWTQPTIVPPTTTGSTADWKNEMLGLVNTERANAGLQPVTLCGTLNKASQAHADDIAGRGVLTHTGADGSSPAQRQKAAGYLPAPGQRYIYGAENAGMGYRSVAEVMRGWMGSAGHRANILASATTHLGVGRTGNFWVQNFGTGGTC